MNPPDCAQPPPRLATDTRRRRPLVSLTPLIDVVFILLVFFMLASSFLDWRAIDLSAPVPAAAGVSSEPTVVVEVGPDGPRLAGEPLSLSALARRVADRLAARPGQPVLVKPAPGVSLQETIDVLERLAAAGVTGISLARDPAN